jgi:putative membrane protein
VSASSTRPALLTLSAVLAAATVLAQIAYPLTTGESLRRLTVITVVCFAAASVTHAIATRGVRWGLTLLAVAGGIGLCAEAVGVRTGMPFGRYAYADSLGSKLLDVPVIVPLAWVMMSYPCLLLGRRLGHDRTLLVALSGGLTLAAWDLFSTRRWSPPATGRGRTPIRLCLVSQAFRSRTSPAGRSSAW